MLRGVMRNLAQESLPSAFRRRSRILLAHPAKGVSLEEFCLAFAISLQPLGLI